MKIDSVLDIEMKKGKGSVASKRKVSSMILDIPSDVDIGARIVSRILIGAVSLYDRIAIWLKNSSRRPSVR